MEEKKRLETDVAKFVQAIVNNLTARFPIIQAARIFDPAAVPGSDTDCAAYGESDLLLLTSQNSSFVTRPVKTGNVGTNYTPSLYSSYFSTGKIYFHSVTCIMMPIKFLLRAENYSAIEEWYKML